jgi:hypothetical protein
MPDVSQPNPPDPQSPSYVEDALSDAERLLKYAAEMGIDVDANVRASVLGAREAGPTGWNEKTVGDLLAALTSLAAKLKPVTAESLKAFETDGRKEATLFQYKIAAVILALFIVFFSFASFITNAFSTTINTKIGVANGLAAKLRAELGPAQLALSNSVTGTNDPSKAPPGLSDVEVITDLQQYASTIRDIYARAEQLNWFILQKQREYYLDHLKSTGVTNSYKAFQLEIGLPNLWESETNRTALYQHVRSFAQGVIDDVSTGYGGFGSCILPVLYALFGTCAFLLRNYEQQLKARTFVPSASNSAHFIVAGICGAVVGLFNINVTQGLTASPLAIAFLVGYGVDVFFAFLEGILQMFVKGKADGVKSGP